MSVPFSLEWTCWKITTQVGGVCSSPSLGKNINSFIYLMFQDMGEEIANEEADIVRKENLEFLARRDNLIRGNKALRKERDKKEAEIILKEIDEIEKRRRIQTAVTKSYPVRFYYFVIVMPGNFV